MRGSVVIVTS